MIILHIQIEMFHIVPTIPFLQLHFIIKGNKAIPRQSNFEDKRKTLTNAREQIYSLRFQCNPHSKIPIVQNEFV